MKKLWNYFKAILLTLPLLFALLCTIVVFRLDSSVAKIDHEITQESVSSGYTSRAQVILISYADGNSTFFQNQNSLVQSAADKGFDHMHQFKRGNIDKKFWNQNERILKQKTGAGFWLWKPYLILQTMKQYPENSIIVYADGAIVFTKPIEKLLKLLKTKDAIFDQDGRTLSMQLKKESYDAFSAPISKNLLNSPAIQSDFMIIKNTQGMRNVIGKWLEICSIETIGTNSPLDPSIQVPEFSWYASDQAILTIVVAMSGENILILPKEKLRNEFGVKNYHRKKHREFSSPLWLIAGMPDIFSRAIWNSEMLMRIRKQISVL